MEGIPKRPSRKSPKKLDQMGNERITRMLRVIFSFTLVKSKAASPYLINLNYMHWKMSLNKLTCDIYNEVETFTVCNPNSASIKARISGCRIFNPQSFPSNDCSVIGHQTFSIFSPSDGGGLFHLTVQRQRFSRKYRTYIRLRDLIFGVWLC